jgi:hypothetical protein
MLMRQARALLVAVVSVLLVGCGGPEPNKAARDACGDLHAAKRDLAERTIDGVTFLEQLRIVAARARKSNDEDMIDAGVSLGSYLGTIDVTNTQDLLGVGAASRPMSEACEELGL